VGMAIGLAEAAGHSRTSGPELVGMFVDGRAPVRRWPRVGRERRRLGPSASSGLSCSLGHIQQWCCHRALSPLRFSADRRYKKRRR
jgi:hypothetical protein